MNCFRCQRLAAVASEPCPHWYWSDPDCIAEDDPKYLIFMALTHRVNQSLKSSGSSWMPSTSRSYRMEPTSRDFAMIEHGDQFRIEDVCWRVTARNTEKKLLFVRCWKAGVTQSGRLVEVEIHEDLAQAIAEAEFEEQQERALTIARETGSYSPEMVDFMTDSDWESLTPEQRDALMRYEETMK